MSHHHHAPIVETWLRPRSLRPFIETVARWIGYSFDDSDWTGISHGVATSDADASSWFVYPLVGVPTLQLFLARIPGDDPISVRVSSDTVVTQELLTQVRTAAELCNTYDLT